MLEGAPVAQWSTLWIITQGDRVQFPIRLQVKTRDMPVAGVWVITGHAKLVFKNQLTAQTSTNKKPFVFFNNSLIIDAVISRRVFLES